MHSPRSLAEPAERFATFAGSYCGLELEPFQHVIAAEIFTARRELLISLPRGQGKTSLLAALALFKLLSTPDAQIYACAASRD